MAGELKHGPLALVDDSMPVLMIVLRDPVYTKCMNALLQVKARECHPILICEEDDKETMSYTDRSLEVPRTVDCLQVISKHLTKHVYTHVNDITHDHGLFPFSGRANCYSNATACLPYCCFARVQRRLST